MKKSRKQVHIQEALDCDTTTTSHLDEVNDQGHVEEDLSQEQEDQPKQPLQQQQQQLPRKRGRPPKQSNDPNQPGYHPPTSMNQPKTITKNNALMETIHEMEAYIQKQKMKKMIKKTIQKEQLKQMNRLADMTRLRRYSKPKSSTSGYHSSSSSSNEDNEEDQVDKDQHHFRHDEEDEQEEEDQIVTRPPQRIPRNPLLKSIPTHAPRRVTRSMIRR